MQEIWYSKSDGTWRQAKVVPRNRETEMFTPIVILISTCCRKTKMRLEAKQPDRE